LIRSGFVARGALRASRCHHSSGEGSAGAGRAIRITKNPVALDPSAAALQRLRNQKSSAIPVKIANPTQ
jgi:hypothetical protein